MNYLELLHDTDRNKLIKLIIDPYIQKIKHENIFIKLLSLAYENPDYSMAMLLKALRNEIYDSYRNNFPRGSDKANHDLYVMNYMPYDTISESMEELAKQNHVNLNMDLINCLMKLGLYQKPKKHYKKTSIMV